MNNEYFSDMIILAFVFYVSTMIHILIAFASVDASIKALKKQIKETSESVSCTGRYVCYNKKK